MTSAPELQQLASGVWAYIQPDGGWMINNTGLVAGPYGATSIDATSTEKRMRAYLRAVEGATDAPVRRIVLTHSHPDHCNGASLLPDAEIVAHRSVADDLRRSHALAPHIFSPFDQGAVSPRLPTILFGDALTIDEGGHRLEVRHPGGPAHTTGDAYVWLPEDGVLFTGDLVFHGGTPFALSGSPAGWLRALEQLAALEPETVVPGHGAVGGPELLAPVADYLRFLLDAAESAHRAGLSAAEAARGLDLGPFGALAERERIVGNLHRALAELDGTEPDVPAAWQDMYEYNGSQPLDCHA
ncbi:MBL fold metallo-hydrolase [Microbacterium sp. cx-55]|uniref:MBL fold metallo-hydrolase n=1 Tax=Microbacterium sp. cx-55 TaxID=2875948 RepID=UPI001CBF6A5D|nr:MBL fold metallo-hydrolase [Microbacterium sp. cx-55]MBZ4487773.1 MBL fold metallo-hydrolase [Microbacterium sp. cx-55]UGB34816.1 MBL fold metallo-hydrolase [Microbacterium sp. cx-55]